MTPSPTPPLRAPAASGGNSSGATTPTPRRARALALLGAALLASACTTPGATVSDTYCRDTFFWRTSARDTAETRRQADLHNSRRLCRCNDDCTE